MNYYLDTEFIEGRQKEKFPISLFRKYTKNTIDLISIGIVAEDGREYYAISKDFNLDEAWNRFQIEEQFGEMRNRFPLGKKVYWLRENVLYPIFAELFQKENPEIWAEEFGNIGNFKGYFERTGKGKKYFKELLIKHGKTNNQIAEEIKNFCGYDRGSGNIFRKIIGVKNDWETRGKYVNVVRYIQQEKVPSFYAYYADYDWVAFCWLFGKMMDLPKGFPMYCNDLKQIFDEKVNSLIGTKFITFNTLQFEGKETSSNNFHDYEKCIKNHREYPKQQNKHSAIYDARWNKKLHEFLKSL